MAGFEIFTKRMAPLGKTPGVTIQKRGTITMNRAAYALLGEPSSVELLFDREKQLVGLRPVEDTAQHGYKIRAQGSDDTGPMVIAGTAFTNYYNIDTTASRRWVPKLEDGILMFSLADGVEITSNRSKASHRSAGEG